MKDIIAVVGEAFVVICGVAVTQFFTGGTVVDTDPAFRTQDDPNEPERKFRYVTSYILALIILVTLALRFLIGSHVQMTQEYGEQIVASSFRRFVTDVCFLMFFGAFIVGVAQAKSVRAFMGWLAIISAAGVVWSFIALLRGASDLNEWWLAVNSGQLVLTAGLSRWCRPLDTAPGLGRKAASWALVIAGVWFMIIFVFDLQKMILKKIIF
ncbi:MAG TPA: hypothetical protein VKL99_09970 [Candidatus Angelobacter sp.]|nr:hypothetical protein [Candidatus Angelobacter sp.]